MGERFQDYSWIQDIETDFPWKVKSASKYCWILANFNSFSDVFSVYSIFQVLNFESSGFSKFWTFTHTYWTKGDYWSGQWFSSIVSHFKMGTILLKERIRPQNEQILSSKNSTREQSLMVKENNVSSFLCPYVSSFTKAHLGLIYLCELWFLLISIFLSSFSFKICWIWPV